MGTFLNKIGQIELSIANGLYRLSTGLFRVIY
jgi:hypothetical protein